MVAYGRAVEGIVALDRAARLLDQRAQVHRRRAADGARHSLTVGVVAIRLGYTAAGDSRRLLPGRPGAFGEAFSLRNP